MMHASGSRHGVALVLLALLTGCETFRPVRPQPGRDRLTPCPPGQIKVCFGRCVTPSVEGGDCDLDECAPGARVCRDELTCAARSEATRPGVGRCVQAELFCDPDVPQGQSGNRCPSTWLCVRYHAPNVLGCLERPGLRVRGEPPRGVCKAPQFDGEPCDSEWMVARAASDTPRGSNGYCRPCAPGLLCWDGACRRPCGRTSPITGETAEYLGACRADPPSGLSYRCIENSQILFRPVPGVEGLESAFICTTCGALGERCPSSSTESLPVVETRPPRTGDTRTIALGPDTDAGSRSGGLCCATDALCLDGTCCLPPGEVCRQNSDCCGVQGSGSLCCADPGNQAYGWIRDWLCRAQADRCVRCGGDTGVPCPPGAGCTSNQDCDWNAGCFDGTCELCGGSDQRCCPSTVSCRSGVCDQDNVCRACGAPGLRCCPGGRCGPSAFCEQRRNLCVACGGSGESCCPDQACRTGNRCSPGGICVACGALDQPCCPARTCGGLLQCQGPDWGRCEQRCGAVGQTCCPDRQCVSSARCLPAGTCVACGALGQRCCEGAACLAGTLCSAQTDQCVSCGGRSQPCCPGLNACQPFLECIPERGRCECGGVDQPCCRGQTCDREPDTGALLACVRDRCVHQ